MENDPQLAGHDVSRPEKADQAWLRICDVAGKDGEAHAVHCGREEKVDSVGTQGESGALGPLLEPARLSHGGEAGVVAEQCMPPGGLAWVEWMVREVLLGGVQAVTESRNSPRG